MSHRLGRVSHIVREVVSDAIAHRISDPRVSTWTSVTRVEMSPDLRIADVHLSVMGPESEGRTSMKGLESARGMIQSLLAKQLTMRQCPLLRFHLDLGLKAAAEICRTLDDLARERAIHGSEPGATTDDASESARPVASPGTGDGS